MNTPTLTSYEESIAPWNQTEQKLSTYFVTAKVYHIILLSQKI